MSTPVPSPFTDDGRDWDDPDVVFEVVMFRVVSTDEDWDLDVASGEWDLTREEAARRLDDGDYSNPFD